MSELSFLDRLLDGVEVEWMALGDIAELYGGLSGKNKADFDGGEAKFISYKNIFTNIEVDANQLENVRIGANERQNAVKYGDVLFTGSSEIADESGMSSAVTVDFDGDVYLNSFCFGLRFNEGVPLSPKFSKYLFRSKFIRSEISRTASGVTRFNISKGRFKTIQIPIPCPGDPIKSLAIQAKIVCILDTFSEHTSELISELIGRRQQYNHYRDQLLSFKEGEVGWKTLGDVGEVRMCKRIFKDQTSDVGEIPFYKIGTFGRNADAFITRELFERYRGKYSYPLKGEVLISASGTIGRAVVFDGEDSYFQDSNIIWIGNDEKKVLNKYLFYFYQVAEWKPADGGVIDRLYNDNLRKVRIPIPYPDDIEKSLVEQARVVAILDKFDALTNSIREGLPREIKLRQKQYEYYRDLLFSFPKPEAVD